MQAPSDAAARVRATVHSATSGLIERDQLAELIVLAAVAQEHLLIIGPPGTAKSAVVRRVAAALGGRYFEYLLGRFTEPAELFGPVDLRKLREGSMQIDVTGMLPEADIAFLDEVFLGSTAILNTLLGLLNERRFRRGQTDLHCPLRLCVGAANALPEDDALAAFSDRFLLHLFVDPVADHQLEALLAGGWQSERAPLQHTAGLADLDLLCAQARMVDMDGARTAVATAIRTLRGAGMQLSDRRLVKTQRLIAAACVLAGRTQASEADLWPLFYVLPTREQQTSAQDLLRGTLAAAANPTLRAAVEQAALQPLSRTARLVEAAQCCLQDPHTPALRTMAEALLREIDANFTAASLPAELAHERTRLIEQIGSGA
ncbi:AAA family ATPase [Xanthomonas phaseoli]|uniref:AAA family ATPase n=1 Tax=Xanthomonas phaseoli pv. dieffenbachiae TaxID=92828 RepID=A0A1V9HDU6_9XANT|nr:AAA family ATPase [Xanthomonas phaseoli]MBO9790259.1 AAA family ATPase [Xanthomonas phaseoli pv. dieffenbachiae]MBO9885512.1 AAA family ATPase [Xanthomonas phaseoli pv. dieffenbachiae]MBO9916622.1 AAA family ATPase [Xanthomonas phaseoli pv. dieffenbachiae]MBO9940747.1 AAA family ATPase [Xanthomonas phaseoli pv. dieffenbachiae]MBO9997354.1 AAA family ATPase [Xanthomonas phaseoli pv. dieffenbachiae]